MIYLSNLILDIDNICDLLYTYLGEVTDVDTQILSNLIIKDIRSAAAMHSEKNSGSKRNCRELWAVVIKYEGETVYTSNGKMHPSDINHINILPKGASYSWRCTESGHFSIVEFDCDAEYKEIFTFNVKNGEAYLAGFKKIELARTLETPTSKLDAMCELYGIISSLIRSCDDKYTPSSKYRRLLPALEYIAANCTRRISNSELAKLLDVSTVYFRKLFKEITGTSPISYALSLRLKKAAEMLESDYSSISDIAYSLGYNNVYEFSKSFKKSFGVSPSEYQKRADKPKSGNNFT